MASSASASEGQIAGLYDLERTLGKGHFAVVKLARHVFTGERVAVKVIDKSKLDAGAAAQLVQEVRCMKLVQHPHVVRLYQVIDTQAKLYLVLELGDGGDMFDHILRHEGGLAEAQAKHYFAQVVHAIAYCHRLHVVHRDLKPENVVFFRQQQVVKLTDFGFSHCFQPGTLLDTSCGSLAYSAPEILLGDQYDAPAVDVWSLGVILYMLVCGHPPFQEANDSETLTMILDCRYVVPPHLSSQCADLISRMLQRDPHQRASLEEIESHPWLQGVDPSPASRSLLPLTSHHRLSEQEHAIILQAMTGGQIADRETIQEALEANCYNHVTATYFLLAERLLREKQERQKPSSPSLVYDLAQQVQSGGASSDSPSGEGQRPPPLPESKSALESLVEPSEQALHTRLRGDPSSSSDYLDCSQPFRALLQPSLLETPLAKSTPALQQISEEGEEEEEGEGEEEGPKPGLFRRRSSSLNQEQMRHFQSSKASWLFCRGRSPQSRAGKSLAKAGAPKAGPSEPGMGVSLKVGSGGIISLGGPGEKAAPQACKRDPAQGGIPSPRPLPCHGGRPAQVAEGEAEGAPQGSAAAEKEEALSPQALAGHSGTPREATVGRTPPESEEGQVHPPPPTEPPKPPTQESQGTENGVKLDPGKGKSPHLKDRLLQFPLCEKALAFRMRPTSKESLLSLSQFNCCHVI